MTAVCFILLSSPLLLFSVLRSCLDEQGAKREITRHNLRENVQALVSLLQEDRLFASRLSRFAVFVAFWHFICLFLSLVLLVSLFLFMFLRYFCSLFSCCSFFSFVSAFCALSVSPVLQNFYSYKEKFCCSA